MFSKLPTTINPILFWRLKPVFLDVKVGTYLPDPHDIEAAIEKYCVDGRGAVMLAHTLGNPWPAHRFMGREGIFIIEDNCDALGSVIDGRRTGTLGHLATHSFYPAHHMTTGEGGMVVTSDGRLKLAVESIRDWGRDCWCDPGKEDTCGKRFEWEFPDLPAGYDHKYVYSHLGLNLKSTDIQAALGTSQMKKLDRFIKARRAAAKRYFELLADVPGVILPPRAGLKNSACHLFVIRVNKHIRDRVFEALRAAGVGVQVHYLPVYLHPYYKSLGYRKGQCPRAEAYAEQEISIPLFPTLTHRDQEYVVKKFRDVIEKI